MGGHQYTDELQRVNKRIGQVEDYFQRLDQRLERIEQAILGDDKYGQSGYKDRIEKLEGESARLQNRVDELDSKFKLKNAYIAGAGAVGGAIIWLITQLITLLR
jgi:prefoldin subunit 5